MTTRTNTPWSLRISRMPAPSARERDRPRQSEERLALRARNFMKRQRSANMLNYCCVQVLLFFGSWSSCRLLLIYVVTVKKIVHVYPFHFLLYFPLENRKCSYCYYNIIFLLSFFSIRYIVFSLAKKYYTIQHLMQTTRIIQLQVKIVKPDIVDETR